MYWINIVLFSLIVVPYAIRYIRRYKVAPASVWFIMEIMFFYGICLAPKARIPEAIKLETIYVIACVCYIVGLQIARSFDTPKQYNRMGSVLDEDPTHNQMIVIWIIVVVAIVLCTYLFVSGGINVFLQAIKDLFTREENIYSDERRNFFGVAGQGYVYQFRVVLLPILSFFLLAGLNRWYSKIITVPLFALMLVFLLGTGQRNAFVFYCAIIVAYTFAVKHYFDEWVFSKFQIMLLLLFAGVFLIMLTISNGRVDDQENAIWGAIKSLVERVLFVNQKTAIFAFEYIDTQPTVWGYDWWMMLKDILPGQTGYLSVDRIVYYLAYGTFSGTGPPCLWGSAWYNFGLLGVTVFPFIMGIFYHNAYKTMDGAEGKNKLYFLVYSALCVYMGLWVYGTPMTLFNNGVVTVLLLRWVLFTVAKTDFKEHSY